MTATKVQIKLTEVYAKGFKGSSKSMTVEVTLKQAYKQIKELFDV